MKKEFIIVLFVFILQLGFISSTCDLKITLLNQDPFIAIPGDYVKVVFQIEGIENPECGIVSFKLKEDYPFSLDPESTNKFEINSGTYSRKYSSFFLANYKLRVDDNALEGDTPIEMEYSINSIVFLKEFNLSIKNTRADFEVHVKDYNYDTKELTFEILNIKDIDVEALTIEIPKQKNIKIKGSNKIIAGDLDSNEYTTTNFEAIPQDGKINLIIHYTDSINVRRSLTKQVIFDSSYFKDSNKNKYYKSIWLYILIILIVLWFVWNKIKKNKKKKLKNKH